MSRDDAIKVEGAVVEALNHRLFRVELANGHRLLAHLSRRVTQQVTEKRFRVGDTVTVEMSPFDFSKGRIRLSQE